MFIVTRIDVPCSIFCTSVDKKLDDETLSNVVNVKFSRVLKTVSLLCKRYFIISVNNVNKEHIFIKLILYEYSEKKTNTKYLDY